jgi:Asp-tRNA(Asn)/Glu-tRNA(Gln) amidotransferase A subunit family amidase
MNLRNITADKLVALYKNREISVTEVIKSVYEEIEKVDKDVRALLGRIDRAAERGAGCD